MGGTLGTAITWPLLGVLIENLGWIWAFYIPGALSILWCLLWYILISNTPETNRWIGEDEKMYIMKSHSDQVTETKVPCELLWRQDVCTFFVDGTALLENGPIGTILVFGYTTLWKCLGTLFTTHRRS